MSVDGVKELDHQIPLRFCKFFYVLTSRNDFTDGCNDFLELASTTAKIEQLG